MPLDAEFLEILACPGCKTRLVLQGEQRLVCTACRLAYPVRDEIPILLLDEAIPLDATEAPETSGAVPQP